MLSPVDFRRESPTIAEILIAFVLLYIRSQIAGPPRGQSVPSEQRWVTVGAAPGPVLRLRHEILQLQRAQQGEGGEHLPGHGWAAAMKGPPPCSPAPLWTATHIAAVFWLLLTDAQLLTIKSKEENDFVSEYLYNDPLITSRTWLGMNLDSQGDPHPFRAGAHRTTIRACVLGNILSDL